MDVKTFARVAESLRQYRRAELIDFEKELKGKPVDLLYVDPLPSDAILQTVLASNTTFLLGRKGTGKSTIFARAQSVLRQEKKNISIYVDVKSLYELIGNIDVPVNLIDDTKLSKEILESHLLRKSFLSTVLGDLLKELRHACNNMPLFDRWLGKKRSLEDVMARLLELQKNVYSGHLTDSELPILQIVTKKTEDENQSKVSTNSEIGGTAGIAPAGIRLSCQSKISAFDELLNDQKFYSEYSDAILRSFPFAEILHEIKDLLDEAGLQKLFIFFDDFSEINQINQRLFVDVILAPLNNSSDERVKLKIAAYPGRVYYGKIDPGKIDTVNLDFSKLYKAQNIQTAENEAIEYTKRLIEQRFRVFKLDIYDYLEDTSSIQEYMRLFFETTMNIPRLLGYILYYCFQDRIAKGQKINVSSIRLAAQKYYDDVLKKYFDRMNRFALEPFDRKLDRHNQQELLKAIITEAKSVRRRIISNEIGGNYFAGLTNPPVSHFTISQDLETVLSSLEFNFLITKYHEMRDKDGNDVTIYALFYGLCELERLPWGYPKGRRDDRSYFVQRCFVFNSVLHSFLSQNQTIRCANCSASFPMDKKESFSLYNWVCPECREGKCSIVNLSDDYLKEIEALNKDLMLEEIELQILETLHTENRPMPAGEISIMIDVTYQFIGKRTAKLQQLNLVKKDNSTGVVVNSITNQAIDTYFSDKNH